jgi:hypothetical protein
MSGLARVSLGSALILSVGHRMLPSRTFASHHEWNALAEPDKNSSPQNAATRMLQACAPRK